MSVATAFKDFGKPKAKGSGQKPEKTTKVLKVKHSHNAMIISERRKLRMFRYLKPKFIPSDSFERKYKGQWLHILRFDMDGKFYTLERPPYEEDSAPTDLFMALHCADEVEETYGLSMPTSEKIKWAVFITIFVIDVIFAFILAFSGGSV